MSVHHVLAHRDQSRLLGPWNWSYSVMGAAMCLLTEVRVRHLTPGTVVTQGCESAILMRID